jgi:thioesterase domain-containing protein
MVASATDQRNKAALPRGTGDARIVQLRTGGPGPALFLVPGTGGRIEGFAALADSLRLDMRVFAIEARGVSESATPDTSVEDMAEHYLSRILPLQPTGPYCLAGHSFGGLVVLEMALRLLSAQKAVACLIMLDTPLSENSWPFRFYVGNVFGRAKRHMKRLVTVSLRENCSFYLRRLSLRRHGLDRIPADQLIGGNIARVMIASEIARKKYKPAFYSRRLTFFRSPEAEGFETLWKGRVAELDVRCTAGGHINMIDPPFVESLANDISLCLAQGVASSATPSAAGA